MSDKTPAAVGGQVERRVMPRAWVVPDFGFLFPTEESAMRYLENIGSIATATPLYAMPDDSMFEVCDADGVVQAETRGPREQAKADAEHYAFMYAQDGPVEVFEVLRVPVRHNGG